MSETPDTPENAGQMIAEAARTLRQSDLTARGRAEAFLAEAKMARGLAMAIKLLRPKEGR